LTDVREFNRSRPEGLRLHVLGFDAQNTTLPADLLLASQRELGISAPEAELLSRVSPKRAKAFAGFSPEDAHALMALLERIEAATASGVMPSLAMRANIAAHSLRLQLGYISQAWAPDLRDAAMAELAELVRQHYGDGRASLWAHNGHLAREPDGTTKSMGQHLSARLGGEYYPIAFLAYAGAARAWDPAQEIGVIPQSLGPTPAFNLESVILHTLSYPEVAWVRLDTLPSSLQRWMQIPRYTREFGAVYTPDDTQILRKFPQAFEAVVIVKTSLASTPTATGERRAER
jgi:erythromycin esterase-like protein